jgi:predicted HNH restriction endonuclease
MAVRDLKRYQRIVKGVIAARGPFCEACGAHATHVHHIIPVSETRIHSPLVFDPANMIILCDECHALCHPLIRNISDWRGARGRRGARLTRHK